MTRGKVDSFWVVFTVADFLQTSDLQPMSPLRDKFILAAFISCFFAVGMAGFLNYFKFKRTADGVLQSRMLLIGANIESNIQSALAIGLSFPEIPTLAALIQREKMSDVLIQRIDIFDNDGRLTYSTEPERVGETVQTVWQKAALAAENQPFWRIEEGDNLGVGVGLQNNFGVTVGQLLIRYSRESLDRRSREMGMSLLLYSILGLSSALTILIVALHFVYRRFMNDLKTFESDLSATLHADGKNKLDSTHEITESVEQIGGALRAAHTALDDMQQKIDKAA